MKLGETRGSSAGGTWDFGTARVVVLFLVYYSLHFGFTLQTIKILPQTCLHHYSRLSLETDHTPVEIGCYMLTATI